MRRGSGTNIGGLRLRDSDARAAAVRGWVLGRRLKAARCMELSDPVRLTVDEAVRLIESLLVEIRTIGFANLGMQVLRPINDS